jgi:hypothetical protein
MQNIIEKALKAFKGQTEPPPALDTKGWWTNRAIATLNTSAPLVQA